jgi:N-acyl-D-amino-acid deacylase
MKVNWLFKNVTVIDGSGGPQYVRRGGEGRSDCGYRPGAEPAAEQVIDGQGRVLAPGLYRCAYP